MSARKLNTALRSIFAIYLSLVIPQRVEAQSSGVGYSSTEIRIGNLMPYSGPASSYGVIGKLESAYVEMINGRGGVNGRQIKFISYDDAYSPPKSIEQARRLVESDEVVAIFSAAGTPTNAA